MRGARVIALETHRPNRTRPVVLPALYPAPAVGWRNGVFDRSWYNRAGVERVMGFVPQRIPGIHAPDPELERMLVNSGIRLFKYWFGEPRRAAAPLHLAP